MWLRPFRQEDVGLIERFAVDASFSEPFQWGGFRWPHGYRRRWEEDGFLAKDPQLIAVAVGDDVTAGWMMWRTAVLGVPVPGVWEVGAFLVPEHRRQGFGTVAHGLLVEHLFATTPAHRLCAFTEAANTGERKTLERSGFRCEGVMRRANFVRGDWRDVAIYGLLREDASDQRR